MVRSKWIRLKSPQEKVHRVCARMLRSRLAQIARYLPLAAKKSAENVEYVHQLRVWTRRADAVVELCGKLLAKSDRRNLQRQLDLLRDAAGAARDADVLRQRVAALKPGLGCEHLLKDAEQRRAAVQEPIGQANEKLRGGKEVLKLLAAITARLKKRRRKKLSSIRFKSWARERIRPLIKRFLKRGEADLTELARLHKLRIAGKRLRYALELAWDALDKSLRKDAYRQLDRLQQQLGSLNDARHLILAIEQALAAAKKRTLQTQLRRLLTAQRRSLAAALENWAAGWSGKKAKRLEKKLERLVD